MERAIEDTEEYKKGFDDGEQAGYDEGYDDGLDAAKKDYYTGHTHGLDEGYKEGFEEGLSEIRAALPDRFTEALNRIPVGPMREAAICAFEEVFSEFYFYGLSNGKVQVVSND